MRRATLTRTLVFGNSASGKSTLAKKMSLKNNAAHLDLDTIAWQATLPPTRTPIVLSENQIKDFINSNDNWIIEGCYSDLLTLLIDKAEEIIFLNISVDDCISNAQKRPWEPHKYESKEAQDKNLNMLIQWISQYPEREDNFSQKAHLELFNSFRGKKEIQTSNR